MNPGITSLRQLDKIYLHKCKIAERLFLQQQLVVAQCAAELADITASVLSFRTLLISNSVYMTDESACTNAKKMMRALKYKEQIDYDIEREEYFRVLAEEELQAQRIALDRRRFAIEKIRIRRETLADKIRKILILKESFNEIEQEDNYQQMRILADV